MTRTWQLEDTMNTFSAIVEEALKHGPQVITRQSVETAVMLSYAEYRKLALSQEKLSDFFRESPLAEVDLDLARDTSGRGSDYHRRI